MSSHPAELFFEVFDVPPMVTTSGRQGWLNPTLVHPALKGASIDTDSLRGLSGGDEFLGHLRTVAATCRTSPPGRRT